MKVAAKAKIQKYKPAVREIVQKNPSGTADQIRNGSMIRGFQSLGRKRLYFKHNFISLHPNFPQKTNQGGIPQLGFLFNKSNTNPTPEEVLNQKRASPCPTRTSNKITPHAPDFGTMDTKMFHCFLSKPQRGNMLAKEELPFLSCTKVRILPHQTSQAKKLTLDCGKEFQSISARTRSRPSSFKTEKQDLTE